MSEIVSGVRLTDRTGSNSPSIEKADHMYSHLACL